MVIFDDDLLFELHSKYADLHPLLLQRSIEKANNSLELFEILESIPNPPFSWDENSRSWAKNMDILSKKQLKKIFKK